MIEYAHNKGFYTLISTNGCLIHQYLPELLQCGLDRIDIAIDGATQKTQSKYRIGSNLDVIKNNIRRLVILRPLNSKLKIVIQTVVSSNNENQIKLIQDMAKNLGVDEIKFKSLATNLGGSYISSKNEQMTLLPKNNEYHRKGTKNLICAFLWESVILWNGDVSICCTDYHGDYVAGNLLRSSFNEVMYNDAYLIYRKNIVKKGLALCYNCPITGDFWLDKISIKFR